jgi:putative flippase GtrA
MTDTLISRTETLETPPSDAPGLARKLARHKEFRRFSRFLVVGAIGFVIDFGVSNLMWAVLPRTLTVQLPFDKAITYVGIGGAIGFVMAISSNFVWNRYWTYPDSRSKPIASQFVTFFLINLLGIVIRIPVLELTSRPLGRLVSELLPGVGVDTLTFLGANAATLLGKNLSLSIAVVIVLFWNFFINRYLTYNDID